MEGERLLLRLLLLLHHPLLLYLLLLLHLLLLPLLCFFLLWRTQASASRLVGSISVSWPSLWSNLSMSGPYTSTICV